MVPVAMAVSVAAAAKESPAEKGGTTAKPAVRVAQVVPVDAAATVALVLVDRVRVYLIGVHQTRCVKPTLMYKRAPLVWVDLPETVPTQRRMVRMD